VKYISSGSIKWDKIGSMGRRFEDNICDNIPVDERKQKKISVSIDPALEEQAWVLATYGTRRSVSAVIEDALRALFESEAVSEEIEEAYDLWKTNA
jgi:hypothetical protein